MNKSDVLDCCRNGYGSAMATIFLERALQCLAAFIYNMVAMANPCGVISMNYAQILERQHRR